MAALVVYEGERNAAGQMEGHGTKRWADGEVYEGQWKGGMREGRGTYRHANGDVYEGQFKANKKEGRGTYRFVNGDVYEGEYGPDDWRQAYEKGPRRERARAVDVPQVQR